MPHVVIYKTERTLTTIYILYIDTYSKIMFTPFCTASILGLCMNFAIFETE